MYLPLDTMYTERIKHKVLSLVTLLDITALFNLITLPLLVTKASDTTRPQSTTKVLDISLLLLATHTMDTTPPQLTTKASDISLLLSATPTMDTTPPLSETQTTDTTLPLSRTLTTDTTPPLLATQTTDATLPLSRTHTSDTSVLRMSMAQLTRLLILKVSMETTVPHQPAPQCMSMIQSPVTIMFSVTLMLIIQDIIHSTAITAKAMPVRFLTLTTLTLAVSVSLTMTAEAGVAPHLVELVIIAALVDLGTVADQLIRIDLIAIATETMTLMKRRALT